MRSSTEKNIARDVQQDLARVEESLGVPADQRERVSEKTVRSILKVIEDNDAALRFLATR